MIEKKVKEGKIIYTCSKHLDGEVVIIEKSLSTQYVDGGQEWRIVYSCGCGKTKYHN